MFTLWLTELQGDEAFPELRSRLLAADSLLLVPPDRETEENRDLTGWSHLFPEVFGGAGTEQGFDIVIGNPPWGKIKTNVNSFLLNDAGTLAALPQGQAQENVYREGPAPSGKLAAVLSGHQRLSPAAQGPRALCPPALRDQREDGGRRRRLLQFFVELAFQIAKETRGMGWWCPRPFICPRAPAACGACIWNTAAFPG